MKPFKCIDIPLVTVSDTLSQEHLVARVYEPVPARKRMVFYTETLKTELVQVDFPELTFVRMFNSRALGTDLYVFVRFKFDFATTTPAFGVPVFPHVYPTTNSFAAVETQPLEPNDIEPKDYIKLGSVCVNDDRHVLPSEIFFSTGFHYFNPAHHARSLSVDWLTFRFIQQSVAFSSLIPRDAKIELYPIQPKELWDEAFVKETSEVTPNYY